MEIAEQEAEGVAQLAIDFSAALHQVFAGGHIFAEVNGGYPEADDFASHAVGDIDRVNAVAEGFAHGAALLVEGPAGGGDVGVRRVATQGHRSEQGGVEPAAMLVASFEIQNFPRMLAVLVLESCISVLELRIGFADCKPACAGVEPDVENIGFLAEILAAAICAGSAGGEQSGYVGGMPGLNAFALYEVDEGAVERGVDDRLIALRAHEDGDGHAPDALAADAPVGARGDHVGDALLAPGWVPDDFVDLFNGQLAVGGLGAVLALDRGFK